MFAMHSRRLRRRLSVPTSGSLRRRARERQRAEQTRVEGERLAREHRERRTREKFENQRKAREELASYDPWGRAGGGAPNQCGIRFTNLRATGIFPEDELRGISLHECSQRWASSPKRRRHLTPLRLREDPQLCYAENLRRSVDNDIRYKQTPGQQKIYKQILDEMVDKRKKAVKDEIKRNLEYERKMGWTDNEIFSKLRGDHRNNKRSSLALPQVKRVDDSMVPKLPDKENIKPSSVEKLPVINQNNSGRERSNFEEKVTIVNGSNGKSKRSPKTKKFVKRLSNGDKVRRMLSDDDFDNGSKDDVTSVAVKKLTPETAILRVTGGVELVPLLARRRRIGARTLPSSDVTRPPEQSCQWREILNEDYLRELKHQMRVKCEQKEESRRNSAESVKQHHITWSSLWGRPGHGAPQQRGRYARSNLAQLLYVAPLSNTQ